MKVELETSKLTKLTIEDLEAGAVFTTPSGRRFGRTYLKLAPRVLFVNRDKHHAAVLETGLTFTIDANTPVERVDAKVVPA
jgi:hypothetical protein